MILLFGAALLFLPTDAWYINRLRLHLIDNLKIKCESLPYRSVFDGTECHFAVYKKVSTTPKHIKDVEYDAASNECSSVLKGTKVALSVPEATLEALRIDKSKFHTDTSSLDAKNTLCVFESGYKCEKGQTMVRGKCGIRADKKMNFADARKHCSKLNMDLFTPDNDKYNQIVSRELVQNQAWTQTSLANKGGKFVWTFGKSYTRFTTCESKLNKPALYAGYQAHCNAPMATVVGKSGYWSNTDQKNEMDVICTKVAGNQLTPIVVKKKPVFEKYGPCAELHEMDESTGKCEWTGPTDACAQLSDYWNETYFIRMEHYPSILHIEECLRTTRNELDDYAVKVVVRKGCMFTGYSYPLDGGIYQENKVAENLIYGVHKLPNYMSWNFSSWYNTTVHNTAWKNGLTRANCFCDPTEATVNDHVPAPPPDNKCIDYHEFNEESQQCEWTLDPKFCGEIITNDNRRMRLEIPKWPENRKYDVNHWTSRYKENFHVNVVQIIVRQHCFATVYTSGFHGWKTLPTMGYGKHTVASNKNGLATTNADGGSSRFVCECIK